MHIELIAVGQKMPDWVNHGFADYAVRFTGDLSLGLNEIPLQKRGSSGQLAAAQQKEAAQIKAALHGCDRVITLDLPGHEYTSEALAARLNQRAAELDAAWKQSAAQKKRAPRKPSDPKLPKEPKQPKEPKEPKDPKQPKDPKKPGGSDPKDPKDPKKPGGGSGEQPQPGGEKPKKPGGDGNPDITLPEE